MQIDPLTLISLGVGIGAIALGLWQTMLTRRALHAQAYMGLEEIEMSSKLHTGVRAIASLAPYTNYDAYSKTETSDTQDQIFDAVIYLSFTAHLVDEGFLSRERAWKLYLHTYALVQKKLLPWWLEGPRRPYKGSPDVFAALEQECKRAAREVSRRLPEKPEETGNK